MEYVCTMHYALIENKVGWQVDCLVVRSGLELSSQAKLLPSWLRDLPHLLTASFHAPAGTRNAPSQLAGSPMQHEH
jgi:hypothetical protein